MPNNIKNFKFRLLDTIPQELDGKIDELTEQINANPNDPELYYQRWAANKKSHISDEISEEGNDLDKAIELNDKDFRYYYSRGINNSHAIMSWSEFLGVTYVESLKTKKWFPHLPDPICDFMKVYELHPDDYINYFIARQYDEMGDYKNAKLIWDKIRNQISDRTEYYVYRAKLNFRLKNYKEAISDVSKAIKSPENYSEKSFSKSDLFFKRGECYLEEQNFQNAVKDFEKAREMGVCRPDQLWEMAYVYFIQNKMEKMSDILINVITYNNIPVTPTSASILQKVIPYFTRNRIYAFDNYISEFHFSYLDISENFNRNKKFKDLIIINSDPEQFFVLIRSLFQINIKNERFFKFIKIMSEKDTLNNMSDSELFNKIDFYTYVDEEGLEVGGSYGIYRFFKERYLENLIPSEFIKRYGWEHYIIRIKEYLVYLADIIIESRLTQGIPDKDSTANMEKRNQSEAFPLPQFEELLDRLTEFKWCKKELDSIQAILNKTREKIIAERYANEQIRRKEEIFKARLEERNKIIADLSHSLKNIVATVTDPLENLRQAKEYVDITIDNALRGANLIREITNAMNNSLKGSITDFYYDAEHNQGSGSQTLAGMVNTSLQNAVANMFDTKYFSTFSKNYFSDKDSFYLARNDWAKIGAAENIDQIVTFIKKYLTKIEINLNDFGNLTIGNDKGSAAKLLTIIQEMILNAIKYSSFIESDKRIVRIKISGGKKHISLSVENKFKPQVKVKTTGMGQVILKNFAEMLNATLEIRTAKKIYSVQFKIPNFWKGNKS